MRSRYEEKEQGWGGNFGRGCSVFTARDGDRDGGEKKGKEEEEKWRSRKTQS